jgi:hypothetical protein
MFWWHLGAMTCCACVDRSNPTGCWMKRVENQPISILLLADTENGNKVEQALAIAYEDPHVTDFRTYTKFTKV